MLRVKHAVRKLEGRDLPIYMFTVAFDLQ